MQWMASNMPAEAGGPAGPGTDFSMIERSRQRSFELYRLDPGRGEPPRVPGARACGGQRIQMSRNQASQGEDLVTAERLPMQLNAAQKKIDRRCWGQSGPFDRPRKRSLPMCDVPHKIREPRGDHMGKRGRRPTTNGW